MNSPTSTDLFSPVQMGDLTLKNRVVLAPLTRGRSGPDRIPNAVMAEYYGQRAGAGLVITEATAVSESGNAWTHAPGIYTTEQANGWKPAVKAAHDRDSRIFLQLWFGGRASHSSFVGGDLPVAPSAIAIKGEGVHTPSGKQDHEVPRALETHEMPGIVQDYVSAAKLALKAGFDGVEIHSANGYLLDQFLQTKTNKRTDEYGGSLPNRLRLLREIIAGISEVFPSNRIGVRLSPNGVYNDMGSKDFRETVLYAASEMNSMDLGYLHVVDGLGFGFHELGEAVTLKEIRAVYSGTLMGNCGYDLETAQAAIAEGSADTIAFGRPFIANPDLVERLQNGWPLAESNPEQWFGGDELGTAYTDFPAYKKAAACPADA
ncbi:MAG: N-ethylmaleimide reductase [Glaciecola sp.]|jgi:N-ethylmaleimide reductase